MWQFIHLKDLSYGPMSYVKEWHTYFVNGYKFHTQSWTKGKKTVNSGIHVTGLTEEAQMIPMGSFNVYMS